MKAGDLVRHKTYGHTGLILSADPRYACTDYFLIMWSDWPDLPQENNHTCTLERHMEVINASR